jgi:hypothetical protein
MDEQDTTPRTGLAWRLVVLGPLLAGFAGWTVVSMFERFQDIWARPDLNGDGKFSVLDVPHAVAAIIIEIGHRYQAMLAESKIGSFLEMRSEDPNLFWSIRLAGFTYFLIVVWSMLLLDNGTSQDEQ